MSLEKISCSSCGSTSFNHDDDGNLVCAFCGSKFASPREELLCAACGMENPAQAQRCMKCGLMLGKACPNCHYSNPPGADYCEHCASPLDILETVFARARTQGRQVGISKEKLVESKQADMEYMAEQRRKLDEEERLRRTRLLEQRQQALKQQRTMIMLTLGGIGFLVLFGLLILLLSSG